MTYFNRAGGAAPSAPGSATEALFLFYLIMLSFFWDAPWTQVRFKPSAPPTPTAIFSLFKFLFSKVKIKIFYHVDVLMENLPFHLGQDLDGDFVL